MDTPGLHPGGPLEGRLVRVEPIEERHREGLRAAAEREPQIHRFTNMYTLGFDRWFDLAVASETEVPFVVHVDGRPVGSSRYLNVEPMHKRLEIGWTWLERAQWGTGANVETKYLLLRNAFDSWGAMRVEFKTDARNLRVRGALLGVGATFDGIFRKHMILPDSIRDSAWYSIVDDEDRKSTRLNSSHMSISYAVFCLKKKKTKYTHLTKQKTKKRCAKINSLHLSMRT